MRARRRIPRVVVRSPAAPPDRGRHRRPRASPRGRLLSQVSGFGQREVYGSAAPGRALDADLATLCVHDGTADGEAEPNAAGLIADLARAEEALEEPRLFVLGDPGALVAHRHAHESLARGRADDDLGCLG